MIKSKRKSAADRAIEFFDSRHLKKLDANSIEKSDEIFKSIKVFWDKWLSEHSQAPYRSVYIHVFNIIKVYGACDVWCHYNRLRRLNMYSLKYFIGLHGDENGQLRYNEYRLSCNTKTTQEYVDMYLRRKKLANRISTIDDIIYNELLDLFSAFDYDRFKDQEDVICDLIIHYVPNFKERFTIIKDNSRNIYSDVYYQARYGDEWEDKKLSDQERLRYYSTKVFKSTVEYWMNLGYSEEDAHKQVSISQTQVANRSAEVQYNKPRARSIEFWTNSGYSYDESREIVKSIQSRDEGFFINTYGTDGIKRYQNMLDKRSDAWYSKDELTRIKIGRSRARTHQQSIDIYGEERALDIIKSRTVNNKLWSKESNNFFMKLEKRF